MAAGGWEGVFELRRAKEYWRGDERILGDGDFANEVLKLFEEELNHNEELKAAEESAYFVSVASEAPITMAKKSLWQASKDYTAGKYAAAGEELEKASRYLKKESKSTDEKTMEETKKLGKDIDAFKDKLKKGDKTTEAAITNLLERSRALSEREAESFSTGWQKLRSEYKVKTDLIEAKLHIAYAEIYQFIIGDTDKAGAEIDKVKGYLNSATENADSKVKTKINAMGKKMDEIKKDLHNKKEDTKMQYEIIKGDLRQLIKDL